jgi:orotidine-5'-phosphate decarboxylase
MSTSPRDRLIVPLDYPSLDEALELVGKMGETISWYKVGLELFSAAGPEAVRRVKELGKSVFLDLKFHDIPNTVAGACRMAVRTRADMFNVHVSGGAAMMRAAAEAMSGEASEMGIDMPILLGVTVLTSLDREALENEVGISVGESVAALVAARAKLAMDAGLGGVVASPKEVERIREACGQTFHIVTPGVRPTWAATGDQKRIATPADAIRMGADRIVVGRPITQADDPLEAAGRILEEISQ